MILMMSPMANSPKRINKIYNSLDHKQLQSSGLSNTDSREAEHSETKIKGQNQLDYITYKRIKDKNHRCLSEAYHP